jgi:uncharacterized protein (DUF1501 family)
LAAESLFALERIDALDTNGYQSANGALYPDGEFDAGLEQVATLTKAEMELENACLGNLGGWDAQIAQGSAQVAMVVRLGELTQGLSAFYGDLAEQTDQFLVVVMSGFGRRVKENGGLSPDHDHSSVMVLLGSIPMLKQPHDLPGRHFERTSLGSR